MFKVDILNPKKIYWSHGWNFSYFIFFKFVLMIQIFKKIYLNINKYKF